jgi:WD40 repeat protein
MLPNPWWGSPQLLFSFLGAKKTVLLLGGGVGIGIAIFTLPQAPDPGPVPFSARNPEVAWIRGLAFVGDSLIVATRAAPAGQDRLVGLQLWEAASGRQQAVLAGHAGGIGNVAFTPDGRFVASEGYDGSLRMWDVATGRERAALQRLQSAFHPLAFDAAGGLAWMEDAHVQHWDPVTGALSVAPPEAVGEAVSMAFSADGRLLATAGSNFNDFATRLWELPAGTFRAALPRHPYPIVCVTFSPSGRLLATGDWGGGVQLWDTHTGQPVRALPGLSGWARALAFSAGDSSLAAADVDGTLKLWDVATGREQGSFSAAQFSHEEAIDGSRRLKGPGDDIGGGRPGCYPRPQAAVRPRGAPGSKKKPFRRLPKRPATQLEQ